MSGPSNAGFTVAKMRSLLRGLAKEASRSPDSIQRDVAILQRSLISDSVPDRQALARVLIWVLEQRRQEHRRVRRRAESVAEKPSEAGFRDQFDAQDRRSNRVRSALGMTRAQVRTDSSGRRFVISPGDRRKE